MVGFGGLSTVGFSCSAGFLFVVHFLRRPYPHFQFAKFLESSPAFSARPQWSKHAGFWCAYTYVFLYFTRAFGSQSVCFGNPDPAGDSADQSMDRKKSSYPGRLVSLSLLVRMSHCGIPSQSKSRHLCWGSAFFGHGYLILFGSSGSC